MDYQYDPKSSKNHKNQNSLNEIRNSLSENLVSLCNYDELILKINLDNHDWYVGEISIEKKRSEILKRKILFQVIYIEDAPLVTRAIKKYHPIWEKVSDLALANLTTAKELNDLMEQSKSLQKKIQLSKDSRDDARKLMAEIKNEISEITESGEIDRIKNIDISPVVNAAEKAKILVEERDEILLKIEELGQKQISFLSVWDCEFNELNNITNQVVIATRKY